MFSLETDLWLAFHSAMQTAKVVKYNIKKRS